MGFMQQSPISRHFCILLQICPSDAMKILLQIYQLKLQVAEIDSIAILQSILFQLYVSYCTEQEERCQMDQKCPAVSGPCNVVSFLYLTRIGL